MIGLANIEFSFRELAAVAGLFVLFAGMISIWVEQRIKTRNLERDVTALQVFRDASAVEQSDRYREILLRIGAIDARMADQSEKVDALYRMSEKIDSLYRLVNEKRKATP